MVETLDLRALRVLAAVLDERHVGRAARSLGLGQPAVSYHLARLREVFDDELFVRDRRGVAPTPRLLALEGRLRALLTAAAALREEPGAFDPARVRREVRIASLDYERLTLLAEVVAEVSRAAPGCRLSLVNRTARDLDALAAGTLDLLVGPRPAPAPGALHLRRLFVDTLAVLARPGHPLVRRTRAATLEQWASFPHVTVIVEGTEGNAIDRWLARHDLARRVLACVASFDAACAIVARTDALVVAPKRLVAHAQTGGLVALAVPIEPRTFGIHLAWHERARHDPLLCWLRERIVAAARTPSAAPTGHPA